MDVNPPEVAMGIGIDPLTMGILMGIVWMNHQQGEIHLFSPHFFLVCPRISKTPTYGY